jgi:hypothetical protein
MQRTLKSRPSPALVISLIALFVALGGTSYAAFSLPKGSVGPAQLKNKAVTPLKVAPATVRLFKGQKGAQGLRGPKGPTGAAGTNGTNGTNGANGATKVVIRSTDTAAPNANTTSGIARCNAGEQATGGGATISGVLGGSSAWQQPGYPVSASGSLPPGWAATYYNNSGFNDTLTVYVICASP